LFIPETLLTFETHLMKITILAPGSRGDVQPFIALGMGLQSVGYEVCIATNATFETFICNHGLGFFPIQFDMKKVFDSDAGQVGLKSGRNLVSAAQNFRRVMNPMIQQLGDDCWAASQETDAIIHATLAFYFAPSIAENFKVPHMVAFLHPQHPTSTFPSFLSPIKRNLGGFFNRLTQIIPDTMLWLPYRSAINQWHQKRLNLPPFGMNYFKRYRSILTLYGFSPSVVSKPPDWGNHIEVSGYWFLNDAADWQPPNELIDFLEAGSPPVYVGFGSMTNRNPEETTDIVLKALARTKQRGLLLTGWGGLKKSDLPDNVFKIESAPHEWLFPRMAAIVHHGGAGTTGASLRAGIPTIVVPFFFDQPFWGQRVADLGVGPQPIPRKKLSVERLTAAITTAVTDKKMQERAAALGERIRAEDGVARAVEFINRSLSTH